MTSLWRISFTTVTEGVVLSKSSRVRIYLFYPYGGFTKVENSSRGNTIEFYSRGKYVKKIFPSSPLLLFLLSILLSFSTRLEAWLSGIFIAEYPDLRTGRRVRHPGRCALEHGNVCNPIPHGESHIVRGWESQSTMPIGERVRISQPRVLGAFKRSAQSLYVGSVRRLQGAGSTLR